jgi:hypothetical protein
MYDMSMMMDDIVRMVPGVKRKDAEAIKRSIVDKMVQWIDAE